MREEYISDAFNMLDDAIIREVDIVRNKAEKRKINWKAWGLLIAAACLVLIISIRSGMFLSKPLSETENLPMLTIAENTSEGMGFEGYIAFDISGLVNANPWNEDAKILTLPVFQNPVVYEDFCVVSGADFEKMEEFLLETAKSIGIDTKNLMIKDDAPSAEERQEIESKAGADLPEGYFNPRKLTAESDGVKIEVDVSMRAQIEFDPVITLPEGYRLNQRSYEELTFAAGYLQEEFKKLLKMENPQINVYGGDYNIYGEQSFGLAFFDKGSNMEEDLINYNFNQISFISLSEGEGIWLIRIKRPDLSEKLGDYPIINAEQARELLSEGQYLSSVPYAFPGEDYIAKAELVYRTGELEKCYMPYYRFYVEIPEEEGTALEGAKTYGAYYVPAVESKYISNMPVWDGGFN